MNTIKAMNQKHWDQLEARHVRIEKLIYLPSMHARPEYHPEFDDLKESYPEEFTREMGIPGNLLGEDPEIISEWLREHGFFGFIAMVHTPVMTQEHEGCCSFSWGRYTQTLVYADSIQELVFQAIYWAKTQHETPQ